MKRMLILACALAVLQAACAAAVGADEISYVVPVPLGPTIWTQPVIVPLFDPALGTLLGVEFTMSGHVEGVVAFENLDTTPAIIAVYVPADIALMRPDYSEIMKVSPLIVVSDSVTEYDGTTDFGGTSGRTYEGLTANLTASKSVPPPDGDLVLFTGTGNINLWAGAWVWPYPVSSELLSVHTSTAASAEVTVKYVYEPIPEPSSLIALLAGLGSLSGFAILRRR